MPGRVAKARVVLGDEGARRVRRVGRRCEGDPGAGVVREAAGTTGKRSQLNETTSSFCLRGFVEALLHDTA